MPRSRRYTPLRVLLNNCLVGLLVKEPSGGISFAYDETWLSRNDAIPVSLSLPLREETFRGEPVVAVFENLLPDSDLLRRRIAEKVGAKGTDVFSLLYQIGRDCIGALQFIPDSDDGVDAGGSSINGEMLSDEAVEGVLKKLIRAPLGLESDTGFRISVAGAQEKTALLWHNQHWWKPHGTTPTTHILKTQVGTLPNGLDLSNSVENEYYCLKLMAAFGLPVNQAEIRVFGKTKALVVERFDRRWTADGRLLRIPQEDFCQALSCPSSLKYQSNGGPGMVDILTLLKAADSPLKDQKRFLKSQILFWLIGATDGHAKNFSIFLGPGGRFSLTPIYDVLTAQPSVDDHQIERKQMKLAMFVGQNRHYRVDEIRGRHFIQTADIAGLPGSLAQEALAEITETAASAIDAIETQLPPWFPEKIHMSVKAALSSRLKGVGLA